MRYGSVCSGIEAATVAWHALGWTPVFFSEIEPFPCSALAQVQRELERELGVRMSFGQVVAYLCAQWKKGKA